VLEGIPNRSHLLVEPDRRAAIAAAIGRAQQGDVVVIAGKGHEAGQEFADHTDPLDDRDVTRAALKLRKDRAGW
jgi:UDP-N-acetylmuramoyl-L-alanyl-D-glutamate--2,6-diaminopimelate ligase